MNKLTIALYQPDIPQNVAAMIRLCACLGIALDLIAPYGFVWDEDKLKRVAMDYLSHVSLRQWPDWNDFATQKTGRRVLLTTKGAMPYTDFTFQPDDVLLFGRESAGVPDFVHEIADARLLIPMHGAARSLNIVTTAAMVAGEALRQVNLLGE